MTVDLTTTNVLLAVLATVAALEAIAIIGFFLCAYLFYRRLMRVISGIEARQVAPVAERARAILDDVREMTSKVKVQAEQVDRFVRWAAHAAGVQRDGQEDTR